MKSTDWNCLHEPCVRRFAMYSCEYMPYIKGRNSRFSIFLVVNNYMSFIEIKSHKSR